MRDYRVKIEGVVKAASAGDARLEYVRLLTGKDRLSDDKGCVTAEPTAAADPKRCASIHPQHDVRCLADSGHRETHYAFVGGTLSGYVQWPQFSDPALSGDAGHQIYAAPDPERPNQCRPVSAAPELAMGYGGTNIERAEQAGEGPCLRCVGQSVVGPPGPAVGYDLYGRAAKALHTAIQRADVGEAETQAASQDNSHILDDLTIREIQTQLPWTTHYHRDFRSNPQSHKDFQHAMMHAFKALGKLAAVVNRAEHGGDDFAAEDVDPYVADLVVCALRMANTCPGRIIDLQRAVQDRINTKNTVQLKAGGSI